MSSKSSKKSHKTQEQSDESDFISENEDDIDYIEEQRMAIARDFNDRLNKWYSIPKNIGNFFYTLGVAYFALDFTKHLITNGTQIIIASYC